VQDITLGDNNEAVVRISVDDEFAPLHEGTTAAIRLTSLSGIANRYVALSPGPNSARELEAGSTLTADRTTTPVDLDQLFSTFDPATRATCRRSSGGRPPPRAAWGRRPTRRCATSTPAVTSTSRLVGELAGDQRAFQDLLVETSRVVTRSPSAGTSCPRPVATSNQTFAAIAAEDDGAALGPRAAWARRCARRTRRS
jgi:phospholipid/cholesterol/gamma-HCH transport system substrate-binding protein